MKIIASFLFFVLLVANIQAQEDCPSQDFIKRCESASKKNSLMQTYIINLRSKKESKADESHKFPLFLSKGETYEFVGYTDPDYQNINDIILTLSDENNNLIVSSYNEDLDVNKKKIKFKCKASGNYIFFYYTEYEKKYCGVVTVSLIPNANTAK